MGEVKFVLDDYPKCTISCTPLFHQLLNKYIAYGLLELHLHSANICPDI